MSKPTFQDIIRSKSISKSKDVAMDNGSKEPAKEPVREQEKKEEKTWYAPVENKYTLPHTDVAGVARPVGPSRPKYRVWFLAIISILVLLFALSFVFAKAKVVVNPKVQNVTLNKSFVAVKDASSGDPTTLPFDIVSISLDQSETVEGGVAEDVKVKATGSVYIYNTTSAAQNLDIDTRLEGSNGKLYKTSTKTTVPKMLGSTPGKVQVKIYADVAGESGNSGPLDFKILGFKGTPKYTKIYARSNGNITGGFTGKQFQIADAQKLLVTNELKKALSDKLLKQAEAQIPSGFILFKDAVFTTMDDDITTTPGGNAGEITASIKGKLSGVLFDEKKLTQKIAKSAVDKYDGSPVHIPNIKNLTFSLPYGGVSLSDVTNINFNLSGPTTIVWDVDSKALLDSLLGIPKKDFNQILSTYKNIDGAVLTIRPFWDFSLPSKESSVQIVVTEPK